MSVWLLRIAGLYLLAGVGLGIFMGASHDFTEAPLHAHINLLGFMILAVTALWYRIQPAAGRTRLAMGHAVLHNVGLLLMIVTLFLVLKGNSALDPLLGLASLITGAGILCLVANIWKQAHLA